MESNSTCQKRVCAICNKEINCPEECFVVEDGTKSSNSYNKQFVYICRDCYEKSKKYTFTQQELDQHDTEVRKPLEEEIAILKQQVNDWIQRFNSSEKRYRDLMISSEECIKAKEKAFYENMKNVVIHQPTQILLKDTENIIPEIKKQERTKVIDELLKWVEENYYWTLAAEPLKVICLQELCQKLNEMKGETK